MITQKYRSLVPIVPAHDVQQTRQDVERLRWLAAESFYQTIWSDARMVTSYQEREVDADYVRDAIRSEGRQPTEVESALGHKIDECVWWEFSAVGKVDSNLMNYLTAEGEWRNQETLRWLAAEREWNALYG